MNNINERLNILAKHYGLDPYSSFAKKTGLSHQTASNYLKGKQKPDIEKLALIKQSFDKLNADWLLTGKGEMLKKAEAIEVNFDQTNVMYVPLVNQYAQAGYLSGFADEEYIEDLPKIPFTADRQDEREYICFEVKGDSMDDGSYDSYLEGDILLCKNVIQDFWKSKLHIKKWDFVIVHKEKGILVKRIINHNVEKGILTLHSLNEYYVDFDVNLNNVAKIFNIVDFRRKRNRR